MIYTQLTPVSFSFNSHKVTVNILGDTNKRLHVSLLSEPPFPDYSSHHIIEDINKLDVSRFPYDERRYLVELAVAIKNLPKT